MAAKPTRKDKKARIESIEAMLTTAANGDDIAAEQSVEPAIAELRTLERDHKVAETITGLFTTAVRRITRDDVVTADEEGWLAEFAGRLGLDASSELANHSDLFEEVVVARINGGRPPVLDSPGIILKPGETAYAEFSVALMKEVAQREFRGGSSGFSIPIGHTGVRYRVGAVRGRSVVVGTQLVAEDTGVLTVTSTRAVFAGAKKTLEFRNDKLVSVQQYTDGLRLGVSNRQAASLFRFGGDSPSIAAALISYSTQH